MTELTQDFILILSVGTFMNQQTSFTLNVKIETTFNNYSCFYKYRDFLEAINKTLVANAKGEPIDIQVLLPLLRKGWVAMDESGFWYWHKNKPSKREEDWRTKDDIAGDLVAFNLKPAEDWRNSLMECGL